AGGRAAGIPGKADAAPRHEEFAAVRHDRQLKPLDQLEEAIMARTETATNRKNHALLHNLIALSTGVTEQGLGVAFGLAADVITECRKCVGQLIGLLESVTQGAFHVARGTSARVGDLLSEAAANALSSGQSIVRLFQLGGEHATALAGEALARRDEESGAPR